MAQAKNGDTVRVHYTAKFQDGKVIDTSINHEPWQFTIGKDKVIPGFEEAVIGMNPGESKTVEVPADKAYGPRRKGMILVVDRNKLPEHLKPEVGQQLRIPQANGRIAAATVIDVSESKVTIDANHPLAGKDLTFDIELIKIV